MTPGRIGVANITWHRKDILALIQAMLSRDQ